MAFTHTTSILVLACAFIFFASPAAAFGAGSIPSESKLFDFNACHGDLAKLLMFKGGLTALNVKQIYFGNWLRDYSQLLDVGSLTRIPEDYLVLVIQIMAFMEFGFTTGEFDIYPNGPSSPHVVGVYRPEEHMDNPKGYPDRAQTTDSRLRGPVQQKELAYTDNPKGMLNYISNDSVGITTSTQYIKQTIEASVRAGREGKKPLAMRHLGAAMHALEDFCAHTNYVELCLQIYGAQRSAAGDQVDALLTGTWDYRGTKAAKVKLQNGNTESPITSGTFGPLDLVSTLLETATDKVSTGSFSALTTRARSKSGQEISNIFRNIADVIGRLLDKIGINDDLRAAFTNLSNSSPENFRKASWGLPKGTLPQLWSQIKPIFAFRDSFTKWIENSEFAHVVDEILGAISDLSAQIDQMIYEVIGYIFAPIFDKLISEFGIVKSALKDEQTRGASTSGFDNDSVHPSHSMIAKDHFNSPLNCAAAQVAKVVGRGASTIVNNCWSPGQANYNLTPEYISQWVLSAVHHPKNVNRSDARHERMQNEMNAAVVNWWKNKTSDQKRTLANLNSRDVVLRGGNKIDDSWVADPSRWNDQRLGIPSSEQHPGTITKIIENLKRAFGSLTGAIAEGVDWLQRLATSLVTNPVDKAMQILLPYVSPLIMFNGMSPSEIFGISTMGNVTKHVIVAKIDDLLRPLQKGVFSIEEIMNVHPGLRTVESLINNRSLIVQFHGFL